MVRRNCAVLIDSCSITITRHGFALGEPRHSAGSSARHQHGFAEQRLHHRGSRYPSDRRRRLEAALEAIKDSGNAMMIGSLTAAIEGRQANLNLPELPDGIAKF
ncbi:hypothetical protein SynA18461_01497 [Synechococcus sp. A18-46.1]|nr:hypothetical protein SynA18461_01497 [Synechococcus sp. A18-46.1]